MKASYWMIPFERAISPFCKFTPKKNKIHTQHRNRTQKTNSSKLSKARLKPHEF